MATTPTKNIKNFPVATSFNAGDVAHISQNGVDKQIDSTTILEQISGGQPFRPNILTESGVSRTLTGADKAGYISCTNPLTTTITVSSEAASNWRMGEVITVHKEAAGDVVFQGAVGVTVNPSVSGLTLSEVGQVGTLLYKGNNIWDFLTGGSASTSIQGAITFTSINSLVLGATIEGGTITDWGDYLGWQVRTVVHNTTSNAGGADYVIVNVNPANLAVLNGGIWEGANHNLGGGFYAKLIVKDGQIPVEACGAIADWNRTTRVGTNASTAIQSAIDYAATFVKSVSGIDPKGGAKVVVSGAHGSGMFRMTGSVRISKSNISLVFTNGASLACDFTGVITGTTNCAVIIVGTGELWLASGTISSTTKYNQLSNIKISRTGGASPIGILSTGTRNLTIDNYHAEQVGYAFYGENTSEMNIEQFSSIGCEYGLVGDARKNRLAVNSPLGVANIDNDFSASAINSFKAYYPQRSGIVFLNCGTIGINNATIGRFSANPGTLQYGLPSEAVGIQIDGGNTNFTKAIAMRNIVFEAAGDSISKTCILIASRDKNNIVRGISLDAIHVQTADSNYTSGILTTLLRTLKIGTGQIDGVEISNSGFTAQTDGYMYPPLVDQSYSLGGLPVSVSLRNNYPTVAYSMSNVGTSFISPVECIERTDMEILPEVSGVPAGWTLDAGSTVVASGGASGVEKSLRFSGNDGLTSSMSKTFNFRSKLSRCGSIYISFWYKGDVAPLLNVRVNGQSDTDRTTKSGANMGRYSAGFYDQPQSTVYRRYVLCFKPFSAGFAFDNVKFTIGRVAGAAAEYVDIKGVEVGLIPLFEMNYNPFA